jgi:hypothetical protein
MGTDHRGERLGGRGIRLQPIGHEHRERSISRES